jgi:hypothetical protein
MTCEIGVPHFRWLASGVSLETVHGFEAWGRNSNLIFKLKSQKQHRAIDFLT